MGQIIFKKRSVLGLLLVIFLSLALTGCSTTVKERQPGQPVAGSTGTTDVKERQPGQPAAGTTGTTEETKAEGEGIGRYYLDDVRVPSELNYKPDKSFVYETPRFKAGLLHFTKWLLDVPSLIDFFTYNMEKDNWKMINIFRGKESFLNFSKPDKTCTIRIKEKWTGTTVVEIQVGPLGEKKMKE